MSFANFVRDRVPRYQPPLTQKYPVVKGSFKVGDRVRVVRNVIEGSVSCIGEEGTIRVIFKSRNFDCEVNNRLFNFLELEHI
jgi:hypothetical protein